MTAWIAFTKKEFLEAVRTGRLAFFLLLSVLFGIMNPAIAKLTPWLMETMAESMEETGLSVVAVEVNAMSSWTQFYKNVPMLLIIFAVMFGGILAGEYQRGTLIHMLTRGMARWKILTAKAVALLVFWTAGYWVMFGLTWGYTVYFWDSGEITYTGLAALGIYLLGVWLISLIFLGSGIGRSVSAVLGTAAAGFVLSYLLSLIPAAREYLPTQLLSASILLTGAGTPWDFLPAALAAVAASALHFAAAVVCFNRKAVG